MSATFTEQHTTIPAGTWAVDATHSRIEFAIEYLAGTFRGSFSPFEGNLVAEGSELKLEGAAPVAGVSVQDENLAAHLQGPDFFDAERAPEIRFLSTGFVRSGGEITVRGELTIRGITKPVELAGTIGDPITDGYGRERLSLTLSTTIDRTAFGIDWNLPLPTGQPALAKDVTLTAELYLVKA